MTLREAGGTLCAVIAPLSRLLLTTLLTAAALGGCRDDATDDADGSDPLHLLAAASTKTPVEAVARRFEEAHDVEVRVSTAASSTLARQIDAGAPADLYLSADPHWVDWLRERDHVAADVGVDVAGNRLLVVAQTGTDWTWAPGEDLASAFDGRLAMGDPSHVPGGRYGREALESTGDWEALRSRLAPTADAPSALTHVARGTAGAGIVYGSDATTRENVRIVGRLPAEDHRPIRYVAIRPSGSTHPLAGALLDALVSPEGREAFLSHGFSEPP
ncbi:MAG: molybdate ABC transporter substrate-binding protein [Myxococcota bacterium]